MLKPWVWDGIDRMIPQRNASDQGEHHANKTSASREGIPAQEDDQSVSDGTTHVDQDEAVDREAAARLTVDTRKDAMSLQSALSISLRSISILVQPSS